VKEKLNEHIVYLQNEIRKRDELLEDSDYEDNLDDDCQSIMTTEVNPDLQEGGETLHSVSRRGNMSRKKFQIEEIRNEVKNLIQDKLRLERALNQRDKKYQKLHESL